MLGRILLSRMTKLPVATAGGERVGRVVDASAVLSADSLALHRLVIGSGRRPMYVVPWSLVGTYDDLRICLTADAAELERHRVDSGTYLADIPLDEGEVLLGRDVLDSQVVDLSGRRLSRVADVLLAGGGDSLAVVAVDLGLGALLRRLGLVRLGDRMKPVLVAWNELHLASARGHIVQLATATDGLSRLNPDALADVLARLDTARAVEVMRTVGPSRSAVALDASHDVHRRRLLSALSAEEAHRIIDAAPAGLGRSLKDVRDESAGPARRFRRTAGWRVHRPNPRDSGT
jgi:hypothetical protein